MSSETLPDYRRHEVSLSLAVNETPILLVYHKEYGETTGQLAQKSITAFHQYNKAAVPISMGNADQMMYKELYKAVENMNNSESTQNTSEKNIMVVFNGPQDDWVTPPKKENGSGVRIRIEAQAFLKRLYEICGSHLDVVVSGYLCNTYYNGGRKKAVPIGKDGSTRLRVLSDGRTTEVTVSMPPGLLEKSYFKVNSELSIRLSWFGPEPIFGYLPHCEALRKKSKPDLKITVAEGNKTYKCHSELLRDHSPVFAAMLSYEMAEAQNKEIVIVDFDSEVVEAFLRYIYAGNIVKPYKDSHFCFELLYFAHKYDINELEKVTIELFKNKPNEWLSTTTAVELHQFASKLDHWKALKKLARSVLQSRRQEVLKLMKEIPELQQLDLDSLD